MNLILEDDGSVRYFTNLGETLDALGISASDYDWFVSDIETNLGEDVFGWDDRWISGDDLQASLAHGIQFIYAVFSAFPKGYRRTIEAPARVYNNANYWSGGVVSAAARRLVRNCMLGQQRNYLDRSARTGERCLYAEISSR